MNAVALAPHLASTALAPPAAPAVGAPAFASVSGLTLTAANCVATTAALLQAACQRGQLEDASAVARIALPLARQRSPHRAMLQALADAQPRLIVAPDEHRLYMLRDADGTHLGLLRLRENGRISSPDAGLAARHAQWTLQDGCLCLADSHGQTHTRFVLCGERLAEHPTAGPAQPTRIYLGTSHGPASPDPAPCLLQEYHCTYTKLSLLDPELAGPFCALYAIDAMVPATLPAQSVLLLAAPHNGAPALAAALNRHAGVHIDGQLLSPQGIGLAEGWLAPRSAALLCDLRSKDPTWFACMMLERSYDTLGADLAGVPVRGFTLAPGQSGAVLDWAMAQSGLRIVLVARSNLLAEFADILADTVAGKAGASQKAPLHFDADRFARFVEMKHRDLSALRERLGQRNADTVEVDASRLNAATLAELHAFVADSIPLPALAYEGIRLCDGPIIDRFDNPAAVLTALAAIGQPQWADVEGPDAYQWPG